MGRAFRKGSVQPSLASSCVRRRLLRKRGEELQICPDADEATTSQAQWGNFAFIQRTGVGEGLYAGGVARWLG
jgi:hypothetical protein